MVYDTHFKMNPPLASAEDRAALIEGLADGTVDAIATDHAPHEPASKEVEFDRAPFGVTGFETALALALGTGARRTLSLVRMVELFTTGPARVLGRKRRIAAGEPADLTIFSTDHPGRFTRSNPPASRAIRHSTAANSAARPWPPSSPDASSIAGTREPAELRQS